jgi:hypothetical protein
LNTGFGVQIPATERLHPGDEAAARRHELLHQADMVIAQVEPALLHCPGKFGRRAEAGDSLAAAADVRLDDDGVAQSARGGERLRGTMYDPGRDAPNLQGFEPLGVFVQNGERRRFGLRGFEGGVPGLVGHSRQGHSID